MYGGDSGKRIGEGQPGENDFMPHCKGTPPPYLRQAIEEFNRHDWYACHETLETPWREEKGHTRDFLQGIIQIAGALHLWRKGNYSGALRLIEAGTARLERAPSVCMGVAVSPFIAAVQSLGLTLSMLGPERMHSLPREILPRLLLAKGRQE